MFSNRKTKVNKEIINLLSPYVNELPIFIKYMESSEDKNIFSMERDKLREVCEIFQIINNESDEEIAEDFEYIKKCIEKLNIFYKTSTKSGDITDVIEDIYKKAKQLSYRFNVKLFNSIYEEKSEEVIFSHRKKVPLFYIIDTSNSMTFNKRYIALNNAMHKLSILLKDMEKEFDIDLQVRVITFVGRNIFWRYGNITRGVNVKQFIWKDLTPDDCKGSTPTAQAIKEIRECIEVSVHQEYVKGSSLSPFILLISDGCSDSKREFFAELQKLQESNVGKSAVMVAIGIDIERDSKATEQLKEFGRNGFKNCANLSIGELDDLLISAIYNTLKSSAKLVEVF